MKKIALILIGLSIMFFALQGKGFAGTPTVTLSPQYNGDTVTTDGAVDIHINVDDYSLTWDPQSGAYQGRLCILFHEDTRGYFREAVVLHDLKGTVTDTVYSGTYTIKNLWVGTYTITVYLEDMFRVALPNPESRKTERFVIKMATDPETTSSHEVEDIKVSSSDNNVMLEWTNPWDGDLSGVVITRKIISAPTGVPVQSHGTYTAGEMIGDGEVIYNGLAPYYNDIGLNTEVTYYYKVFAYDFWYNYSSGITISKMLNNTQPSAVTDLSSSYNFNGVEYPIPPSSNNIVLKWTAPGADGTEGMASTYTIKYSTTTITIDNWDSLPDIDTPFLHPTKGTITLGIVPKPSKSGMREHLAVINLDPETYYCFALKSIDAGGMISSISNVFGTTTIDEISPGTTTDLAIVNPTDSSVMLVWTSPGDDGTSTWRKDVSGAADAYDIRYSTSPIIETNWAFCNRDVNTQEPRKAGSPEVFLVSGLDTKNNEYYFALKTLDEFSNASGLSNVVSVDRIKPSWITDLKTGTATASSVDLKWTSTGDNRTTGTAFRYDIRYSTSPITEDTWPACIPTLGKPLPLLSGNAQTFTVTGLSFNTTYYIALKVIDEAGNQSDLSNVVEARTSDTFPTPPTNIKTIAGDMQIHISWDPATQPDIGGYMIYYGTMSCADTINKAYFSPIDVGNGTDWELNGLINGIDYYISIRSYNTNRYPSDYSQEVKDTPLGLGYQYLPQSIIIPMGTQQNGADDKAKLDKLREAYKAVFEHVSKYGNVEWTASKSLSYNSKVYNSGTFISEFSSGTGTLIGTSTVFDSVVTEPGEGFDKVLGVTKSYSLSPIKIALFYSNVKDQYNQYVTWEEGYFEQLFRMFLWGNQEFDIIDENSIKSNSLNSYDMVILPSIKNGFASKVIEALTPTGLTNIKSYIEKGGVLYAQGDSCYLAEVANLVASGTVQLNNRISTADNKGGLSIVTESSPLISGWFVNETYILDDPLFVEKTGQTTVAKYINTNYPNSPAIITKDSGKGSVILINSHPSDKREYYAIPLNAVLLAMSCKATLYTDGEQRYNPDVPKDTIPGLEKNIPIYVTAAFSNFWNGVLQDVEVKSIVQIGFNLDDESVIPKPTEIIKVATETIWTGTETIRGTLTTIIWRYSSFDQGRNTFNYRVLTEANALKKGEAVVCKTTATYKEPSSGKVVTVYGRDVRMQAKMAARLVGDRKMDKSVFYGLIGSGIHFDVKLPLENKEDTQANEVMIQDLIALVSPIVDIKDHTKIILGWDNTNLGNEGRNAWAQNVVYFFDDPRYPLPEEVSGNQGKKFGINEWDGKTTYIYANTHNVALNIPEKYKAANWGPNKNQPLIQSIEVNGVIKEVILPAQKLTWSGAGVSPLPGYDYVEPAIRYGLRSEELPPDGANAPRTILLYTLPNVPERYIVGGKILMNANGLSVLTHLGSDPIPFVDLLSHGVTYIPLPTDPNTMPKVDWEDIWHRKHTATLRTMRATFYDILDHFPVDPHNSANNTFELFEDKNNNNKRDTGEKLFLEYDITKKAKLRLVIRTWNGTNKDLTRDQNVVMQPIFKGLGFDMKYYNWGFSDSQGIGNPSQLSKIEDDDMFTTLYFQQFIKKQMREDIYVYSNMSTYPDVHREGPMKVNEGTRYAYHKAQSGPNQYQIFDAHVQAVFGIGNNVEVSKKVAPVNIGNYGDEIYHLIKVEDKYEPRQFDMDPFLMSYGYGGISSTVFVGGKINDKLFYSRIKPVVNETTFIRYEVCSNLGQPADMNYRSYNLENVKIEPDPATVPNWLKIDTDFANSGLPDQNLTPTIHQDLEFLLLRQNPPRIPDAWKGVIYYRAKIIGEVPEADQGKVHKIRFILKTDQTNLLPANFELAPVWLGIKDVNNNVWTSYGKATQVTIKDTFPEFVEPQTAKLMTEEEKLIFENKIGWDVNQRPRGTTAQRYFNSLGRTVGFVNEGVKTIFNLDPVSETGMATVPWTFNGKDAKAFYIAVLSKTKPLTSGIWEANAGATVDYTNHFNESGTASCPSETVIAHGPAVQRQYEIEGVRRKFSGEVTKQLILNEENIVSLYIVDSNEGDNIAESNEVKVTLANDIILGSTTPNYTSKSGNTVIWNNLGDLGPSSVRKILMNLSITPGTFSALPSPSPAPAPLRRSPLMASPNRQIAAAPSPSPDMYNFLLIDSSSITFKDAFLGTQITPNPFASFTLAAAPPALQSPQDLTANQGVGTKAGSIIISWTNPNTGTITGYNVYRAEGAEKTYNKVNHSLIPLTNYTDTTLDQDILYYYVVTAIKDGEESNYSGSATMTPIDIWAPGQVTNLTSDTTFDSINLSWVSSGDNDYKGTVSGYEVRYTSSNQVWGSSTVFVGLPTNTPVGSAHQITISNLIPDTQYLVYIIAKDERQNYSGTSSVQAKTKMVSLDETDIDLFAGYNLISLPIKPIGTYTVGSMSAAVKKNGGKIKTVQKWGSNGWNTYIPDLPATHDFAMNIGEGYFVQAENACSFKLSGNKIYTHIIDLMPGWNLVSIPAKGTETFKGLGTLTSISLLKEINTQGEKGTITVTLQKWEGGMLKAADLRLEFMQSMHFPLVKGAGYFILSSETTRYSPNRLRVTNITDKEVSISWLTDEDVAAKIVYGKTALSTTAFDNRKEDIRDDTHYVTLKNLTPNTTYYYDIISDGTLDDNNGKHYSFKTGPTITAGSSYEISGQVKKGSIPAEGAIVYLRVEDKNGLNSQGQSAWLSAITDSSGVWKINLSTVRLKGSTSAFIYSTSGDNLAIEVEGAAQGRGKKTVNTNQANTGDIVLE